jgi:hypothetical protein
MTFSAKEPEPDQVVLYEWPEGNPGYGNRIVRLVPHGALRAISPAFHNKAALFDYFAYFALFNNMTGKKPSLIAIPLAATSDELRHGMKYASLSFFAALDQASTAQQYWIPFLEDMVLPPHIEFYDLAHGRPLNIPIFIHDLFYERLNALEEDNARLLAMSQKRKGNPTPQLDAEINILWESMVKQLLAPPLRFWEYNINFAIYPSLSDIQYQIAYAMTSSVWSVCLWTGRKFESTKSSSLKGMWLAFEEMIRQEGREIIRESQLEEWEEANLVPGNPSYDVRVYFALDAPSPLLLPTGEFLTWAKETSRICP